MNQKDTDYLNQISKNIDTICISIIDELNSQDIKQTWQVENLTITPDQVADQLKSKGGWRKYLKLQIQKNTQATAPVEQIVERFIVNQIALQINDTMIHYIDPDEVPI